MEFHCITFTSFLLLNVELRVDGGMVNDDWWIVMCDGGRGFVWSGIVYFHAREKWIMEWRKEAGER